MDFIRIHINKLGKIVDADIEISPLTIFCGDSGLGKSYLAMLVHYFYAILWDKSSRFTEFFKSKGFEYKRMVDGFKGEGTALSFSKHELEEWLAKDSIYYLRYLVKNENLQGDIEVSLPNIVPENIAFKYKEELTGLVAKDDVYILLLSDHLTYRVGNKSDNNVSDDQKSPFSFLLGAELVATLFGDFKNFSGTFCLPPARGAVMTEDVSAKSGLFAEFIKQKKELETAREVEKNSSTELLEELRLILDGNIQQTLGGEYVYSSRGISIPLSAAASSIREIAPLEMIAKRNDVKTISVLLEEPEAHLHPLKQRMMADVVSLFVSQGASLQITTHSDYFIRRLNELILLYRIKEKSLDVFNEKCKTLNINSNLALDFHKIAAYYLYENQQDDVSVEKQNVENGVPFSTFQNAIKENFRIQDALETSYESLVNNG